MLSGGASTAAAAGLRRLGLRPRGPSASCSSPDWYISVTMSQPPTQLAVDEQLRDRRPVRQRRQLLADPGVGQDVDRRKRLSDRLQDRHGPGGEAARGLRRECPS